MYLTFNGEQSVAGIGSPALFVRLAGCHIRCYLPMLGVLCDTPESLERKSGEEIEPEALAVRVIDKCRQHGVGDVTLTGGDPLWNKKEDLLKLLSGITHGGIRVSIETSGTLDWNPYLMYGVHFVLDYKLPSCGRDIYQKNLLFKKPELVKELTGNDVIKFVIYDWADFDLAVAALESLEGTKARIVFGVYWNGPIKTANLVAELLARNLLGKVSLNVQLHKFVYAEVYGEKLPSDI